MNTINDIKIIGTDEQNPPMVRKEAYIDLFFKLSAKAPQDWCDDFNKLGLRLTQRAKITPATGLVIETYVRNGTEIQGHLDRVKKVIKTCSSEYLEKERQKQLAQAERIATRSGTNSKQAALNTIVAGLDYGV